MQDAKPSGESKRDQGLRFARRLARRRGIAALLAAWLTVGCGKEAEPKAERWAEPTPVAVAPAQPVPEVMTAAWRAVDRPFPGATMATEFRGAWVATVQNIDWPSRKTLSTVEARAEMVRILDAAAALNLNALIFQARPSCDALYASELEPWSEYLTGASGKAPDEAGYDPLAEWISGAHARGMELHVWVNPFRARHFKAESPDAATHVSQMRPELVREYAKYLWLDPGEAEAQEHSLRVILDIVKRYDVDGVHIDDYFYPYPEAKKDFPDDPSWNRYESGEHAAGRSPMTRPDWRRDNINRFVERMYREVKAAKGWVRVGVSPFGIWRPGNPEGVKGFDAFAGLYADARLWMRQGWMDYAAPQLYWALDAKEQPYRALLDWWRGQWGEDASGQVIVGNYTSRVPARSDGTLKAGEWEAGEIERQIEATRAAREGGAPALGNIHFSMVALLENRGGLAERLQRGVYAVPARPPGARGAAAITPRLDVRGQVAETAGAARLGVMTNVDPGLIRRVEVWEEVGGVWRMRREAWEATGYALEPSATAAAAVVVDRYGRWAASAVLARP